MKPLTSASNWQGWSWIVLQLLSKGDYAQHMGKTCCRASLKYHVQRNGLNTIRFMTSYGIVGALKQDMIVSLNKSPWCFFSQI